MMQTLVGREGFAKGMTEYFKRHDGQAVTCDDFALAIADANPQSALSTLLPQFKHWYSQAGTPRIKAHGVYDAASRTYALHLAQSCPPTPGQAEKQPFVIPLNLGLVSAQGTDMPLQLAAETHAVGGLRTFVMTQANEVLQFVNIDSEPVPSILRGFSAPVILDFDYTEAQLLTLLAHDSDPFNCWEAAQRLGLQYAIKLVAACAGSTTASGSFSLENFAQSPFVAALRTVLRNPNLDAAFKELVLTLPSETYIAEQLAEVDPQAIHTVRQAMRSTLASAMFGDWEWAFEAHHDNGSYAPDSNSSGRRALANMALGMLCTAACGDAASVWPGKTYQRFKDANNMTDRVGALIALVSTGHALAAPALEKFYNLFKDEALVLDKWFSLQAGSTDRGGDVLPKVKQLIQHPDFTLKNPNRARSVIFSYCSANPGAFHRLDAAGYVFWADQVLALDAINPQVAARLARALDRWKKLVEPFKGSAQAAIKRVVAKQNLSNDVREVVSRALAD